MVAKKSHFQLKGRSSWSGKRGFRNLCVILAVTLPMTLALRGAWILGARAVAQQGIEIEHVKTQELRAQSRSLSDEILSQIDAVKIRAAAIAALGHFQLGVTDPSILAVAEIGNGNRILKTVSGFAKAPALDPSLTKAIESTIPSISAKQIEDTGVSLVSVRNWVQNSIASRPESYPLAIAFKHPDGSTQANPHYLVAIVNPVETFKAIQRWSNGKDGDMLRGFLIDSTGKVIVHSEKIYNGSNFANHPLFRQALAPTFKGDRVGGNGIYPAADTLSTRVSYSQLRSLPYVVVAERVIHTGSPVYTMQMLKDLATPALFLALVLALACIGSTLLVFRVFTVSNSASIFLAPDLEKELSEFSELHELQQINKRLEHEIMALRARGDGQMSSDQIADTFEKELQAAQNQAAAPASQSELPS
jgi:hypothetical protein